MGNPVIHTAYVGEGKLSILAKNAKLLMDDDNNAGINFLDELDIDEDTPDDEVFEIEEPFWCGNGTSWDIDRFTDDVLPETSGVADILVIYESGDLEGYHVEDGSVTTCDIEMKFVEREHADA